MAWHNPAEVNALASSLVCVGVGLLTPSSLWYLTEIEWLLLNNVSLQPCWARRHNGSHRCHLLCSYCWIGWLSSVLEHLRPKTQHQQQQQQQ